MDNRCSVCKAGYFLKEETKEGSTLENHCFDTNINDCMEL